MAPPRALRARAAARVLRPALRPRSTARRAAGRASRAPVDLQLANSNWTADQIFAETGHRPDRAARRRQPRRVPPVPGPQALPAAVQRRAAARVEGHRHDPRGRASSSASRSSATRARTSTRPRSAASTRRPGCSRSGAGSRASASPDSRRWRAARRSSPPTTAAAASTRSTARPRSSCRRATRRRWPTRSAGCSTTTSSPRGSSPTGSTSSTRDFDWERRTDEFEAVLDGVCAGPAAAPPPTPSAGARRARAVGRRARVGQPAVHAAVRRLGAPPHRRAVRADHRRQRLGVGRRQLRDASRPTTSC